MLSFESNTKIITDTARAIKWYWNIYKKAAEENNKNHFRISTGIEEFRKHMEEADKEEIHGKMIAYKSEKNKEFLSELTEWIKNNLDKEATEKTVSEAIDSLNKNHTK